MILYRKIIIYYFHFNFPLFQSSLPLLLFHYTHFPFLFHSSPPVLPLFQRISYTLYTTVLFVKEFPSKLPQLSEQDHSYNPYTSQIELYLFPLYFHFYQPAPSCPRLAQSSH